MTPTELQTARDAICQAILSAHHKLSRLDQKRGQLEAELEWLRKHQNEIEQQLERHWQLEEELRPTSYAFTDLAEYHEAC